jgi:hypothetical protein
MMYKRTSAVAVSAVSRQLQRIAAESKGRTKKRKKGLVVPLLEKTMAVKTAMSAA